MQTEDAAKIAKLNDEFRRGGVRMMVTRGVQALDAVAVLLKEVQEFNTFTEDNDPYGEHDFGTIVWFGKKIFWKIDYYDQNLKLWEDPLSPKCRRVLTIMLASEY